MTIGRSCTFLVLVFGLFVAGGTSDAVRGADPAPKPIVRIGAPKTMFHDVAPERFQAMAYPFNYVVREQTGLRAQLVLMESIDELRARLADGTVQLAVFHGFEYAWVKGKDANIVPLMVVAAPPAVLQPIIVVKQDNPAKCLHECRGQRLALPAGMREHTRLFLNQQCRKCGSEVKEMFPVTQAPDSILNALDDLYEGKVDVVMVDRAAFKSYGELRPGRSPQLRSLQQSEPFPPGVITYSKGKVDADVLERFRSGMATAHKSTIGCKLMLAMRITGFESIPPNYDELMAEVLKRYPPN